MIVRRLTATLLVFSLVGIPASARPGSTAAVAANAARLGMVTLANRADVDAGPVSAGSTVYDGDHLSTGIGGNLRVRSGAAMIFLPASSALTLHSGGVDASRGGATLAELTEGTLIFSSARASAVAIRADDASIRPAADGATIAQITVAGPKELLISARRGSLAFSYRDESRIVAEGESYRVILDPPDDSQDKAGQGPPKRAGRKKKAALWLLIGGIALATVFITHEAIESPDCP